MEPRRAGELIEQIRSNMTSVFFGKDGSVDRLLVCLLARGHALIEDVPGVGKTVLAMTLARSIDGEFARVQLTPDLLPGDITGVSVLSREGAEQDVSKAFVFRPGPVFANVVLADEINRAPPRTQAALLEAMSEGSVTVDGVTHALPKPFMLVATQNPLDFEGTYPLPENQLDRFLMRFDIGYPSPEQEARVLSQRPGEVKLPDLKPIVHAQDVLALQRAVDGVRVDETIVRYIVSFAGATREHEALRVGVSTRGALALSHAAKAAALVKGRGYVIPEDVLDLIGPVCAHRVVTSRMYEEPDANAGVLESVVETLEVPS